ncbi:unnamed protein product [Prorocentrum cordatum]|uniref:Ureidoglycolate hydrolase n=1 Tax=Prorocentrum cordatum TaxID=2364126 RepID=A0ABN9UT82_9DINO|nr:unnamed protein product [Polarella glacialis]
MTEERAAWTRDLLPVTVIGDLAPAARPSRALLDPASAALEPLAQRASRREGEPEPEPEPEPKPEPKPKAESELVREVPRELATDETLAGLGRIVTDPDAFTVGRGTFEIVKWPCSGWRQLDPGTGDEAGTTEGDFEVHWKGDFFYAENLAVATQNNKYLDGLGVPPEFASHAAPEAAEAIHLWMSDYHPDGGQLFWPRQPVPFVVCLGPSARGDDIRPEDMRAFLVPRGLGVYLHPGTWHNGVYVNPKYTASGPLRFLTRQGRVHARVSASWAAEFGALLRVPLH